MKLRLKLTFSPNTEKVPNRLEIITSWLHDKILGKNNKYHSGKSEYSISTLLGGTYIDMNFEDFKNGGELYISSENIEFIEKVFMNSINSSMGYGMICKDISIINMNFSKQEEYFVTSKCGVVIKDMVAKNKYYTIEDEGFLDMLTNKTLRSIQAIDPEVNTSRFKIEILENKYNKVTYSRRKNYKIPTSNFTFKVTGNQRIFEILTLYGLGHLTGQGYGMIYKTYDWKSYRGLELGFENN